MRLVRLLAAAAIVLVAGCGSPSEEPQPQDGTLRMDFRLGRRPLTRTLTVALDRSGAAADDAVENPSVRLMSDLNGSSGQFPAGQVNLSATALGGPLVQITAVAEPLAPEEVRHGEYEGQIEVSAEGFSADPYKIKITLDDRSRGDHVWKVTASLVVGGVFGTVAKWLNDTGLALYAVRRRFRGVEERLRGSITALPREYRAARTNVLTALREGDVAAAESDLAFLETHAADAVLLASVISGLKQRHRAHVALVRERRLGENDQVREVLASETQRISHLARLPVTQAATAVREARRDEERSAFVGEVLRCLRPGAVPKELRAVLTQLCRGKYGAAVAKWAAIPEETTAGWAADAEQVTPPEPPAKPTTPSHGQSGTGAKTGWWQRVRESTDGLWDHLLAHVRFYAGVFLIVFTGIVGYNERFLGDPSFVGRQSQYFGLFFYAAAVPLGALQVAQLLGRVWPSPGGTGRSTPPPVAPVPVAEPDEGDEEPPAE